MKLSVLIFATFIYLTIQTIPDPYIMYQGGQEMSYPLLAQPDLGSNPPKYFLCGLALSPIKTQKLQYTCNCQQRPDSYKCQWCNQTYLSMSNGVKATFCHYLKWNRKVERYFQTNNTQNSQWRQVICPKNQFVSKISIKLVQKGDNDIGWNSFRIKCEDREFQQSTILQDTQQKWNGEFSRNPQGYFVYSIKVQYIKNSSLTGGIFQFQGMSTISKISIKYLPIINYTPTPLTIQSFQVSNNSTVSIVKTFSLTQQYSQNHFLASENSLMKDYQILKEVQVYPPSQIKGTSLVQDLYFPSIINFGFDKQIQIKYISYKNTELNLNLSICKTVNVKYMVDEFKTTLPFEATITFVNNFTGQFIKTNIVKGNWTGVISTSIKSLVMESIIPNCRSFPAQLTEEQLTSSRWKFYNQFSFLRNVIFKKDKTLQTDPVYTPDTTWQLQGQFLRIFANNTKSWFRMHHNFRDFYGKLHLVGVFVGTYNHVFIQQ